MTHIRFVSAVAALCLSFGVLAGVVGTASAANGEKKEEEIDRTGLYAGVGFGIGLHEEMRLDDGTLTGEELEDAWRLMAWFRPWEYFAFEIGYIDTGDPQGVNDTDGLHLAAVPMLPLPYNFDLLAKVGGMFLEDNDVAVGAGLLYHLPKGFGVRLDWDHLGVEDDSQSKNGDDVDIVTMTFFYMLSNKP
jgi:hypothetical protein